MKLVWEARRYRGQCWHVASMNTMPVTTLSTLNLHPILRTHWSLRGSSTSPCTIFYCLTISTWLLTVVHPFFFFLFPRIRSWNYSRETVTLASLRLPGVSRPVALQPHRDGKITAESPGSVKNIFWYISKFNNEVFACMRQTGYNVLLLNFRCVIQIPFPPVSSCCAKINKLRLCLHSYCKYVRMVWYLTSNMFEWVIHLC